jgi:hypothetical protein
MTLTPKQYEALLAWANRVRERIGAKPVDRLRKGQPQDEQHCPLANTINHHVRGKARVRVDESDVYRGEDAFEPDERIVKTPEYAERFIREFDRGDHPELVGRGWT